MVVWNGSYLLPSLVPPMDLLIASHQPYWTRPRRGVALAINASVCPQTRAGEALRRLDWYICVCHALKGRLSAIAEEDGQLPPLAGPDDDGRCGTSAAASDASSRVWAQTLPCPSKRNTSPSPPTSNGFSPRTLSMV